MIVFQDSPVTARAAHHCAVCDVAIAVGDRALRTVTLDVEPYIGFAWYYHCVGCSTSWPQPAHVVPPRRSKRGHNHRPTWLGARLREEIRV